MPVFPGGIPSRQALDAVVADRPVFLQNTDGHGAWVNSRALELAGIDSRTLDSVDGRIERDADGIRSACSRRAPWAWWPGRSRPSPTKTRTSGCSPARTTCSRSASPERDHEGAGRFRRASVKMMLDGVAENHTAAMLDPYLDGHGCATENAGLDFIDPVELPRYVVAVPRQIALAAYTSGSALVNSVGDAAGSIRLGYDADFAIADADLAVIADAEICQASVRQTWLRGELVYDRS